MQLTMLRGKSHRRTVTEADVDCEGSITISEELLQAAKIVEHEQVHVWDVSNGARIVTYAMRAHRNSGVARINGAAAHLIKPGDIIIVAAFVSLSEAEARTWNPSVVFVDGENRIR